MAVFTKQQKEELIEALRLSYPTEPGIFDSQIEIWRALRRGVYVVVRSNSNRLPALSAFMRDTVPSGGIDATTYMSTL